MKLIHSSAEIYDEKDPFKKIEKIGRTCYKSEDKITDDSCFKFVDTLIKHKHFAMLEHAWFNFVVTNSTNNNYIDIPYMLGSIPFSKWTELYHNEWLISLSFSHLNQTYGDDKINTFIAVLKRLVASRYINKSEQLYAYLNAGDYEIEIQLVENLIDFLNNTKIKTSPQLYNFANTVDKHTFLTFKFICDRGVSHELVRHRASFAQESTRYCNYSKDKYGNELTFIYPNNYEEWDVDSKRIFEFDLYNVEMLYMELIKLNKTPQQARAILPNALKTEVFMTYNLIGWDHFFDMRSIGTTGAPHPDMKELADEALLKYRTLLKSKGITKY